MHTVVSVKNPTGWPREKATGAAGVPVPVAGTVWPGMGASPTCGWAGSCGACCARTSRLKRFLIGSGHLLDVADERLAFMHRDVRVQNHRRQRVRYPARAVTLVAPVEGQANL